MHRVTGERHRCGGDGDARRERKVGRRDKLAGLTQGQMDTATATATASSWPGGNQQAWPLLLCMMPTQNVSAHLIPQSRALPAWEAGPHALPPLLQLRGHVQLLRGSPQLRRVWA